MSEDPFDQSVPEQGGDDALTAKGPVHLAGAGTIAMGIFLVSLSVLFLSSIAAFMLIRSQSTAKLPQWPPPGLPEVPKSLWLSTLVIIISSVTIQMAFNAVRRDDEKKLVLFLRITF